MRSFLRLPAVALRGHAQAPRRCCAPFASASATSRRTCSSASRRRRSKISSSTASGGNSIAPSSRATPRRSGACRASRSPPRGEPSASRASRCARPSRTSSRSCSQAEEVGDIKQKDSETSLIEQFLYPKFGPGQLWEHVARSDGTAAAAIFAWAGVLTGLNVETGYDGVDRVRLSGSAHAQGRSCVTLDGDYFFSTMPVRELLRAMDAPVPEDVRRSPTA